MKEDILKIINDSELVYQVKKTFDDESAKRMIDELKEKIVEVLEGHKCL